MNTQPQNDHLQEGVMVPEGGGTYAYRVVLRDLGPDRFERFVVHDQVLPPDRPPFYVAGDYYRVLRRALDRFDTRNDREVRRLEARAGAGDAP